MFLLHMSSNETPDKLPIMYTVYSGLLFFSPLFVFYPGTFSSALYRLIVKPLHFSTFLLCFDTQHAFKLNIYDKKQHNSGCKTETAS